MKTRGIRQMICMLLTAIMISTMLPGAVLFAEASQRVLAAGVRPEAGGDVEKPEESGDPETPAISGSLETPEDFGDFETPAISGSLEAPEISGVTAVPDSETFIKLQINRNGIQTSADLKRYFPTEEGIRFIKEPNKNGILDENGVYTAQKKGADTVYAVKDDKIIRVFHINIYRWAGHGGYRARGENAIYSDNTERAFLAAYAAGADGVEVDVRRTSDGVLVCFHPSNARYNGKTNSALKTIEEMDYAYVQTLRYTDTEWGDPICSFERCMEICQEKNLYLTIDLKNAPTQEQTDLAIETMADFLKAKQDEAGIEAFDFIGFVNEKDNKNTAPLKAALAEKGVKLLDIPPHQNRDDSPLETDLGDEAEIPDVYQVAVRAELPYPALEYTGRKRSQGEGLKVYGIRHTALSDELVLLKQGTDYKAVNTNNTEVGTANLLITGIGKWSGIFYVHFDIVPKGTEFTRLTVKKNQISLKWNKQAEQTDGYEIQYSTKAKFTSNVKTVTVKKKGSVSKTVKDLKKKKTYYFRIRTYKKTGGKTYYSGWSRTEKRKTA